MRKFSFIMMFLFCMVDMLAQKTDAMLFGDVKSKATGEHLGYAVIAVKNTQLNTVADASGHFKLADLPVGKQTITAALVGYREQQVEVDMKKNQAVEIFFELEEDVLDLDQVVVTGTRTQHYVKNVPIRTEVITSEALHRKNAQTVPAAPAGVPGVRPEQKSQY